MCEKRLPDERQSRFSLKGDARALRAFCFFQASGADVTALLFAVLNEGDFLHVDFERSSGLTIGMADVVAAGLTLTADTAYSRHIDTSHREKITVRKFAARGSRAKQ